MGQAALLARLDSIEQVLRGLLAHAFQLQELIHRQAVEVRNAANQVGIHQLVDDLLAKTLDIHGTAAGIGAKDVLGLADALVAAGAAVEGALLVALNGAAAEWADLGPLEFSFLAGPGA